MEFTFKGGATVKHFNARKEGDEHSKVLALDVKLSGHVPAGPWVDKVLGCDPGESNGLWRAPMTTDEHEPRFTGIESIKSWAFFKNCRLEYRTEKHGALGMEGEAKKFDLKPIGGKVPMVDLTFTIAVSDPSEDVLTGVPQMIQESAECSLHFPDDLFDGGVL